MLNMPSQSSLSTVCVWHGPYMPRHWICLFWAPCLNLAVCTCWGSWGKCVKKILLKPGHWGGFGSTLTKLPQTCNSTPGPIAVEKFSGHAAPWTVSSECFKKCNQFCKETTATLIREGSLPSTMFCSSLTTSVVPPSQCKSLNWPLLVKLYTLAFKTLLHICPCPFLGHQLHFHPANRMWSLSKRHVGYMLIGCNSLNNGRSLKSSYKAGYVLGLSPNSIKQKSVILTQKQHTLLSICAAQLSVQWCDYCWKIWLDPVFSQIHCYCSKKLKDASSLKTQTYWMERLEGKHSFYCPKEMFHALQH